MGAYIIELRDSDGNDCTIYDVLVEAPTKDAALDRVWKMIDEEWPDDEHDGDSGTFHPCNCQCEHATSKDDGICDRCNDMWECLHGGLLLDSFNVEEYPTMPDARYAHKRLTYYHSLIELEN